MAKQTRIAAGVLAAAAALVMLSSSLFLIEHANHDCTGEDCPVCAQLYHCAQRLKGLSAAVAAVAAVAAAVLVRRMAVGLPGSVCAPGTPVFLKVKLSN